MAFADTWHIRSRARQCALTEQAFSEGEKIITALFPDPESSGYLRKDFKTHAWDARSEDEETPFSFWRSTYVPTETHEKVDPMAKEDPETLLRRLIEEDEEHTENVRYILAVMLERKKLLRETDSQRTPSGILRIYEHRKEGDVFIVRDPDIPLAEVETVQEEVFALLESGGRLPEEEPEANGETEAVGENEITEPETDPEDPAATESSNNEHEKADALASADPEAREEPSTEPISEEEESK